MVSSNAKNIEQTVRIWNNFSANIFNQTRLIQAPAGEKRKPNDLDQNFISFSRRLLFFVWLCVVHDAFYGFKSQIKKEELASKWHRARVRREWTMIAWKSHWKVRRFGWCHHQPTIDCLFDTAHWRWATDIKNRAIISPLAHITVVILVYNLFVVFRVNSSQTIYKFSLPRFLDFLMSTQDSK